MRFWFNRPKQRYDVLLNGKPCGESLTLHEAANHAHWLRLWSLVGPVQPTIEVREAGE